MGLDLRGPWRHREGVAPLASVEGAVRERTGRARARESTGRSFRMRRDLRYLRRPRRRLLSRFVAITIRPGRIDSGGRRERLEWAKTRAATPTTRAPPVAKSAASCAVHESIFQVEHWTTSGHAHARLLGSRQLHDDPFGHTTRSRLQGYQRSRDTPPTAWARWPLKQLPPSPLF